MGPWCAGSRLRSSDDQRVTLASAAAERRGAGSEASALELEGDGEHEPCAAGADGMSERHSSAVDVDALLIQPKHPARVERDSGERLVDLAQAKVIHVEAGFLQPIAQR